MIDVLIMLTRSKLEILKKMLPYCRKNIENAKIYVICSKDIKNEVEKLEHINFVDENSIYPNLTINYIYDIIEGITGKRQRAGWYFQQFLKMAWAFSCEDNSYIVIDADTFPLNKLEFYKDGKYLLTSKREYHKPYFDTINILFDGQVERSKADISFVAENMIFDCKIMREICYKIQNNKKLKGHFWFEKILYAVEPSEILKSGFSEFETYGNYISKYYPNKIILRTLRTSREAIYILGDNPSREQLEWASRDYDIISIEGNTQRRTLVNSLSSLKIVRNISRMRAFVAIRTNIRTVYRIVVNKKDFLYD